MPYVVYIAHVVTYVRVMQMRWAYVMPNVYCLSSMSSITFNPSTTAITDYSRSVKDIDIDSENPERKCITELVFAENRH